MSISKKFAAIMIAAAAFSFAAKTVHAEEKIALVSLQKALNEVDEGKNAKAKLKKDFDAKKKQIDDMKTQLQTMSQDLDKQKMVLSQDALKSKTQELQTKYMDLQTKASQYEQELKTQESASAQKILGALRQIVNTISSQDGYTLVIENSTETVLFSKNAVDITAKVISAYNKK